MTETTTPNVPKHIAPQCGKHTLLIEAEKLSIKEGRGRKKFEGIVDLSESIKKCGLINPIVVSEIKEKPGTFNLVAGERRFRAILLGGFTLIPCTLRENLSSIELKEIELEENLRRENLEWTEENELLRQIHELKQEVHGAAMKGDPNGDGWSVEKTAALVGQSKGGVSEKIKFAKLLKERPDLLKRVKKLPAHVAKRQAKQLLQVEKVERLQAQGRIKLSSAIKLGDARELIKAEPDGSIDLLLTDPPFGIQAIDDVAGKGDNRTVLSYLSKLKPADNLNPESAAQLMEGLAPEFFRVLKPSSHFYIFFGMDIYERLYQALTKAGFEVCRQPIIWNKGRVTAPFHGYEPSPCYELILFGHKPPRQKRLSGPCKPIFEYSPDNAEDKIHPFQKPLDLLTFIINQSTLIGEKVFDPFCGSGRTVQAALNCGRSGLGFELDNEHFLKAQGVLGDIQIDDDLGRAYCIHNNNPNTCKLCFAQTHPQLELPNVTDVPIGPSL